MVETLPIPPDLLQQVKKVRESTVSKKSKAVYRSSYTRFLTWLAKRDSTIFTQNFLDKLGVLSDVTEKETRLKFVELTEKFPEIP